MKVTSELEDKLETRRTELVGIALSWASSRTQSHHVQQRADESLLKAVTRYEDAGKELYEHENATRASHE